MRPGPSYNDGRIAARTGVAPALLLDIQTPSGDLHYFSDRALSNVQCAIGAAGLPGNPELVSYLPWLMGEASLRFYRSLQTDTASVTLQNVSGDVLTRDFERIARRSVLEGSLYVLRYYAVDIGWSLFEMHGTISLGEQGNTVQLNLTQLLAGSDDTPAQQVSETCQLVWGQARCGAVGNVECLYTYQSCQVTNHFTGIQTAFEINNPESVAALATTTINRARAW